MVDDYVCKAADSFEPKDADDPSNTAMPIWRGAMVRSVSFGIGVR